MSDVTKMNAEEASAAAVHKAKNAQAAVEIARHVQFQEIISQIDEKIEKAVERGFKAGVDEKRYIDVTRIPLICQSIVGIDKKLDDLVTKTEFWPVKTIVYSLVGLILSGVVGALLMLLYKH